MKLQTPRMPVLRGSDALAQIVQFLIRSDFGINNECRIHSCHRSRQNLEWLLASLSENMIELIQFAWSPFCIVQRRLLEFSEVPFKITNIPNGDRSLVWRLTKERYYGVPIIRDGRNVVFEVSDDSQVIAKYLDAKLGLGLFPWELEGIQSLTWRYIENDIEGPCFRLNDVFYREIVPKPEQLGFLRYKERKFGRGCIESWRKHQQELVAELTAKLVPFEEMLMFQPFLLGDRPRFVDFDLFGMLSNYLYSGHYRLPPKHNRIKKWYGRMSQVRIQSFAREKELHP